MTLPHPPSSTEAGEGRQPSAAEQWLRDLEAVEGDACFFDAMGAVLRERMEGRIA